jgi:light-regulated signal transduction histidine kinase (bacteriophytochrome)
MKKIRLTENELKKMIINVMEQVADNNEGGPNYSLEEYEKMLDSHLQNIYSSINDIVDLFHELSGDTSLDPQDKEDMLDTIRGTLDQLGVDSRQYEYADDYDQTIDVDHEEEIEDTDDEDVTGDMDDENL